MSKLTERVAAVEALAQRLDTALAQQQSQMIAVQAIVRQLIVKLRTTGALSEAHLSDLYEKAAQGGGDPSGGRSRGSSRDGAHSPLTPPSWGRESASMNASARASNVAGSSQPGALAENCGGPLRPRPLFLNTLTS